MKTLKLNLENCYGIKALKQDFDFSDQNVIAIYAPNGVMKSSLAQTFLDLSNGEVSKDLIFPARTTIRKITDENNADISKDNVFVIKPYDEIFGHTEKTSTLLINRKLKKEYDQLLAGTESAKDNFLKTLKELSGSKKDLEKEVSSTFTKGDDQFYTALVRVRDEVQKQKEAPFSDIVYDQIFDEKVLGFLGTKDFKTSITEYVTKYNELLAKSTYFKKGIFNYYNAGTIAKSLANNGFFEAKHSVTLNATDKKVINNEAELKSVIEEEQKLILDNPTLKKKFLEIDDKINKKESLRSFSSYLSGNPKILPELANIEKFKEEIWKSYFKTKMDQYIDLVDKFQAAEKRQQEIEQEARKEVTQWEKVITIFNSRFHVPFKLEAQNKVGVILAKESLLKLSFTFEDGPDTAPVEKPVLLKVLSTGEKKALYVLNIIFEVEARKQSGQETIFVIDDIADSFDYKNKYAIIEYLREIAEDKKFFQIILTHNFDFFRTVNSRYIKYPNCFMVFRTSAGLSLKQAEGIKNVFVNDWKLKFYEDPKKRIASIPFIRNIIEYTKGEQDVNYQKLTSLLHRKSDSDQITQGDQNQF